ncbi:MAG: phospholipase D-like domain-containing protein [Prevotellaceae bacterium]|nr:phospholipase D-like domain-containing protein [Prevotellaceae bacterium]
MSRLLLCALLWLLPLALGAQPNDHTLYYSTADSVRLRLKELGNTEYNGNEAVLLRSPQEKFDSLFACATRAKRYVHLEYFWLANDSVGQALINVLRQKADEGVEVRLLIDDYANRKSERPWKAKDIDSLNSIGIEAAMFDPYRFPWLNHSYHRDHRKIVVVDGEMAFSGGMNVADYYLTGTRRSGQWRDAHLLLRGSVVGAYERVFEEIWTRQTGEELDSLSYQGSGKADGGSVITVVNREPLALSKRMRQAYAASIDAAQTEVRIVSPYPTNVRMVRKAIHRALRRGVRVMIMCSASSDVRVTPDLIGVEMKRLAKRGCEVYFYEGGFHHSKTMTVDGEICTVGTANLDGRSMLFDYEINAFIFDRRMTEQLNAIFDQDLQDSELLTPASFKHRFRLGQRMFGRILVPLRGLF